MASPSPGSTPPPPPTVPISQDFLSGFECPLQGSDPSAPYYCAQIATRAGCPFGHRSPLIFSPPRPVPLPLGVCVDYLLNRCTRPDSGRACINGKHSLEAELRPFIQPSLVDRRCDRRRCKSAALGTFHSDNCEHAFCRDCIKFEAKLDCPWYAGTARSPPKPNLLCPVSFKKINQLMLWPVKFSSGPASDPFRNVLAEAARQFHEQNVRASGGNFDRHDHHQPLEGLKVWAWRLFKLYAIYSLVRTFYPY